MIFRIRLPDGGIQCANGATIFALQAPRCKQHAQAAGRSHLGQVRRCGRSELGQLPLFSVFQTMTIREAAY